MGSELREHRRYNLPLAVKIQGHSSTTPEPEATTRDVSANGVFFFTMAKDCELNSPLEFELVFPAGVVSQAPPRVRCYGRVVRVERSSPDNRLGVAAAIHCYEWVRVLPAVKAAPPMPTPETGR